MVENTLSFAVLVFSLASMEILLSFDNAVILAVLARELPEPEQKKALRYGLWGAVLLRLAAVYFATRLAEVAWIKALGGAYLLWLSIRYFWKGSQTKKAPRSRGARFWTVVFWIEFTDLIFAIDSILAAVALSTNYWAMVTGGLIGVVAIRFGAGKLMRVLGRFPKIETYAYLLVAAVAIKVLWQVAHSY